MQIGRVAWKLKLAEQLRVRRVVQVDRVERVDLLEGDDVAGRADHAHGIDAITLAKPADLPDLDEAAALRTERGQVGLARSAGRPTKPARRC